MASSQKMITHRKALALSVAVLVPALFLLIVLFIFAPVAGLAALLAAVVGAGVLKRRCPQFFAALAPEKKKPVAAGPTKPSVPPRPPSKRTYMMLVGINAMHQENVTINDSPFSIGRDPDCSFRLDHPQVSRHHLTITYETGDQLCYVTDHSSNGTFLNSRPIPGGVKTPLHQGDALQIAGIIFSVEYVHY